MFNFIIENIIERYSREELSQRYKVSLPSRETNASILSANNSATKIDGHFYKLENTNKFKKEKGERAHASLITDQHGLFFESRLSWIQKLLLKIMMFFENIKQAILNYINKLIDMLPNNIIAIIKYLVILPFNLLFIIIETIIGVLQAPGGIIGTVIGLLIALIAIPIKLVLELLGLLIVPIINKVADSMIDKPLIKKMVVGKYMNNNIFNEGIVISNDTISNLSFELKKNILGKEILFVVIKEGFESVSIMDKILSKILPNYFVNQQTVFATQPEFKEQFESIYK